MIGIIGGTHLPDGSIFHHCATFTPQLDGSFLLIGEPFNSTEIYPVMFPSWPTINPLLQVQHK